VISPVAWEVAAFPPPIGRKSGRAVNSLELEQLTTIVYRYVPCKKLFGLLKFNWAMADPATSDTRLATKSDVMHH
jgi:hypothetical protein